MDLQSVIWMVEGMKSEIETLRKEVMSLRTNKTQQREDEQPNLVDDLMTLQEVLKRLKMCNNTFQKFVKNGSIKPIRMGQRVIRYSRTSINALLLELQAS